MSIQNKQNINDIVPTPTGEQTGYKSVGGFQIISYGAFHTNPFLTDVIKAKPHQLYFDLVLVLTKGSGIHHIDFEPYEYHAGTIFILKKGQFHSWKFNEDHEGYLLFFSEDYYSRLGIHNTNDLISHSNGVLFPPLLEIESKQDIKAIQSIIGLIEYEYLQNRKQSEVLASYVNSFLIKLNFEYTLKYPGISHRSGYALFQKFRDLLKDSEPLSRNGLDYSKQMGISYKALNRICKQSTGLTLKKFIDLHVITKAKQYLFLESFSVSDVAYSLGFKEVGNFSKYFKAQTGISPKSFQDSET